MKSRDTRPFCSRTTAVACSPLTLMSRLTEISASGEKSLSRTSSGQLRFAAASTDRTSFGVKISPHMNGVEQLLIKLAGRDAGLKLHEQAWTLPR